eukprot:7497792-Pyramimonas_sp.AAC.2
MANGPKQCYQNAGKTYVRAGSCLAVSGPEASARVSVVIEIRARREHAVSTKLWGRTEFSSGELS